MSERLLAFVNGWVFTPAEAIDKGVVLVKGRRIAAVGAQRQVHIPSDAKIIDLSGSIVAPGFIDMHVHGGGGADVTEGTERVFRKLSLFEVRHGVTSFVASVLTVPDDQLYRILDVASSLCTSGSLPGAGLLGIHLEGPYLAVEERGAHPESLLRNPDPVHYTPLLEYAETMRVVTLAPELPGATELVRKLSERGVVAAAGHTNAIARQILPVIDAGLRHATHMFCNMSHFRRDNLKRVAGAVETFLFDDRVTTELIADGHHLGPTLMKLTVKVKGPGAVCFVTDAMPAAGMPDGIYEIGGVQAVVRDGAARLLDGSAYAGSVTTMDVCVRNGVELIGLSPRVAVQMATETPARILGIDDHKGRIAEGMDADLVVLDRSLRVVHTIIGGEIVV